MENQADGRLVIFLSTAALRLVVFLLHLHGFPPTSHLSLVMVRPPPASYLVCAVSSGGNRISLSTILLDLRRPVRRSSLGTRIIRAAFCAICASPLGGHQMAIVSSSAISYSVCAVPLGGRSTENSSLTERSRVYIQSRRTAPAYSLHYDWHILSLSYPLEYPSQPPLCIRWDPLSVQ